MLKRWITKTQELLDKNPWWEYRRNTFSIPEGSDGQYFFVETPGSSMIVPQLEDGRFILVKQYRYLCDRDSIEFPAGGVKPPQTYKETAAHELEEETGFKAKVLESIGSYNPFNGVTNEMCGVFIAKDLIESQAKPDATEEFEMLYLTADEIEQKIASNEIWDGMTMAAWVMAKSHF